MATPDSSALLNEWNSSRISVEEEVQGRCGSLFSLISLSFCHYWSSVMKKIRVGYFSLNTVFMEEYLFIASKCNWNFSLPRDFKHNWDVGPPPALHGQAPNCPLGVPIRMCGTHQGVCFIRLLLQSYRAQTDPPTAPPQLLLSHLPHGLRQLCPSHASGQKHPSLSSMTVHFPL